MRVIRVRRVGKRGVISIPPELERIGFVDGARVVVQELPSGEVRVIPADRMQPMIREYGQRVVKKNRRSLDILGEADGSFK